MSFVYAPAESCASWCVWRAKTDSAMRLFGRFHHFPDSVEHYLELRIIFLLHIVQPVRQIPVRGQHPPQLDEGAHDGDIHLDCALRLRSGP